MVESLSAHCISVCTTALAPPRLRRSSTDLIRVILGPLQRKDSLHYAYSSWLFQCIRLPLEFDGHLGFASQQV